VTIASRRQDQRAGARVDLAEYYLAARWLAVVDGDPRWITLVRRVESEAGEKIARGAFDPNWALPFLLEQPALAVDLPPAPALSEQFVVTLPETAMARVRHGKVSATVYGGSDAPKRLGFGSGLATDPTWFTFRRGNAGLTIRLAPAFFGTGWFYADGLTSTDAGWRLMQAVRVPYYLPLPPEHRRPAGDYALEADGRFHARMDFAKRPKEYRTLATTINIVEREGEFVLEIEVSGQPGVPVTLELAFTGEGQLGGVVPVADLPRGRRGATWLGRSGDGPRAETTDMFVLREGFGRFSVGEDSIEFGPGCYTQAPRSMESDSYGWINGSLRAEGQRVYLTGVTPFRHELVVR
jgi:hypothetical protein